MLAWSCLRWCFAFCHRELDQGFCVNGLLFSKGVFMSLNGFDVAGILIILFIMIFMDNIRLFLKLDFRNSLSLLDPNSIWVWWTLVHFFRFSLDQVWLSNKFYRHWRLCDFLLILSHSLNLRVINRPSLIFHDPLQDVRRILIDLA